MTFIDEESHLLSPFHPKFKSKNTPKYSEISADNEVVVSNDSTDKSSEDPKPETETSKRKKIPALGIFLALMSVLCYSIGSAIVNLLPELHSIEILVIRSLFQFVAFGGVTIICQYSIAPAEGHNLYLALRCISGTITLTTVFVAYRLMPLADASTIQFSSPVFVAIFAYFLLKERITILQAIAGIITLVGVIIIAQPEFIFGHQSQVIYDNRMLGTILAVVSSVSGGFSMITLRKLKSTPVPVIVMWYSGVVIIVGIIILVVIKELVLPIGWYTWGLLLAVGFCGIGDQYFVSKAMQFETAGPVSVTRTFTIVMTFIWEAVLLGQTVELLSIIGASLITICILMLSMDKWRKESPQTFEKLYSCCDVSDEFYDIEVNKSSRLWDSYNTYYDSIGTKDQNRDQNSENGLYYNQFILTDESTDKPNNHKNHNQNNK